MNLIQSESLPVNKDTDILLITRLTVTLPPLYFHSLPHQFVTNLILSQMYCSNFYFHPLIMSSHT